MSVIAEGPVDVRESDPESDRSMNLSRLPLGERRQHFQVEMWRLLR